MTATSVATPGPAHRTHDGNPVVYAALAGDIFVASVKFWAAHHTGSSSMFSEGVHSTVDALTEVLLLYGLRASHRHSTPQHPIGFGRELFFWNFIVAMTILSLGAGVALFDGFRQVFSPKPLDAAWVSYGVIAASGAAEVLSLCFAIRANAAVGGRRKFLMRLRATRDATLVTVIFSSASGILGLIVVAAGTYASHALQMPGYDGMASIVIAVILGVTALALAHGSKSLLIGVPATAEKTQDILKIVAAEPTVLVANGAITVHLAPDQILVALSVAFRPRQETAQIEQATVAIEKRIERAHPDVVVLMIKPESVERYQTYRSSRGW